MSIDNTINTDSFQDRLTTPLSAKKIMQIKEEKSEPHYPCHQISCSSREMPHLIVPDKKKEGNRHR